MGVQAVTCLRSTEGSRSRDAGAKVTSGTQALDPAACMASSPGKLKTSQMFRSVSCAARCLRLAATNGETASIECSTLAVCSCSWPTLYGCYRRYILVYPQGCDVCNHLSLFLCVADYDKLLPGAEHIASTAQRGRQGRPCSAD